MKPGQAETKTLEPVHSAKPGIDQMMDAVAEAQN